MKSITLFLAMALLFISNAFAVSLKDNWNTIRLNHELLILQPEFAEVMGSEGFFNTCATDETFRSMRPVKVCKEYREIKRQEKVAHSGNYSEFKCVVWKNESIEVSRTIEEKTCRANTFISTKYPDGCLDYDLLEVKLPLTHKLEVVHGKGQLYMHHVMMKSFTIPDCI